MIKVGDKVRVKMCRNFVGSSKNYLVQRVHLNGDYVISKYGYDWTVNNDNIIREEGSDLSSAIVGVVFPKKAKPVKELSLPYPYRVRVSFQEGQIESGGLMARKIEDPETEGETA